MGDKSLEEELGYEDFCPWMEEGQEERDVVVETGDDQEFDEENPEDWVVVDEVEEEVVEEVVEEWVVTDEVAVEEDETRDVRVVQWKEPSEEEVVPKASKKRVRRQRCPVCLELFRHLYRHAAEHLPWFWYPETACQGCSSQHLFTDFLGQHVASNHPAGFSPSLDITLLAQLIQNYLLALAQHLGNSTLKELLAFVNCSPEFQVISTDFKESDLCLCRAWDTLLEDSPDTFQMLNESGKFTTFALVNWKVVLMLLSKLEKSHLTALPVSLVSEDSASEEVEETAAVELKEATDTHLHLDHLLARVGDPDQQEFDQFRGGPDVMVKSLVSNYCFPHSWPRSNELQHLSNKIPGLFFSFGIHPKVIQTTHPEILEDYLDHLEDLIKIDRTVAIGECGLDTSYTAKDIQLQKQIRFLERQLELAVDKGLPVVIHCRGNAALHFQLLDSLSKICPANHPIHWHCFSGIPQVYTQIIAKFSNIVFGVTPFIFSRPTINTFLLQHHITNIVLESDAPFIPYENISDPSVVILIARKISETLAIPLEQVLDTTNSNARRVYQL